MSISPASSPFNGTQSGTYVSSRGGDESFSRSISHTGGTRTKDTVITLANGDTVTRDATFTKTATGWTRGVSTVRPDGSTVSLQTTGTKRVDGSVAIGGVYTAKDGTTQTVSGTRTKGMDTSTTDLSFTNAAGQVRTADRMSTASGDQVMGTLNGTNFGGSTFSSTSALTILQSQPG